MTIFLPIEKVGLFLENDMHTPSPSPFKSGQIEFLVSKDAEYSLYA